MATRAVVLTIAVMLNGNPAEFEVKETIPQESMEECDKTKLHPAVIEDTKILYGDKVLFICSREK
jgi:hypothetical protein